MQYFNYMGMFVVEGLYDKMEVFLNQNIYLVDILLLMVVLEVDKLKFEELLRVGVKYDVKDVDGRIVFDLVNDEIKDFIFNFRV